MKKNGYYYSYYECFPSNKYVMEKQNYLYYMYFPLKDQNDIFRIGVAVSDCPEGVLLFNFFYSFNKAMHLSTSRTSLDNRCFVSLISF